jgi:hypothetical protein
VAEFLLDTEAASRLMRSVLTGMRKSGAKAVSISSVNMAELSMVLAYAKIVVRYLLCVLKGISISV